MRRLALLASLGLSLVACASILGDFDIDPTLGSSDSGAGDAPTLADGAVVDDAAGDAAAEGSVPDASLNAPPVPIEVAVSARVTCATVQYGAPQNTKATFCWGGTDPTFVGAQAGDLPSMGFYRPRTSKPDGLLVFDELSGARSGNWFIGRALTGPDGVSLPYVWGANDKGQCATSGATGIPTSVPLKLQAPIAGKFQVSSVSAAPFHGCMVKADDHSLYCWGQNDSCQVNSGKPTGTTPCTAPPLGGNPIVMVENESSGTVGSGSAYLFDQFAGGLTHSCVLARKPAGVNQAFVACWGNNTFIQTGTDTGGSHVDTPTAIAEISGGLSFNDFELSSGDNHSCALAKNSLVCWGRNQFGQAQPGGGPAVAAKALTLPPPYANADLSHLALGSNTTCVVGRPKAGLEPSRALCFGAPGTLGRASTDAVGTVTGIQGVDRIAVGGSHGCAIARADGEPVTTPPSLFCWGDNTNKQIDPSSPVGSFPVAHRVTFPLAL